MDRSSPTLVLLICFSSFLSSVTNGNFVFEVKHRFKGQDRGTVLMKKLMEHEQNPQRMLMGNIEVPLAGKTGDFNLNYLHYAEVQIGGTTYSLALDTGIDWLWLHCAGCKGCPNNSSVVSSLTRYDEKKSNSSSRVACDDPFCENVNPDGCLKDCTFNLSNPADSSAVIAGHYVRDTFEFSSVTGNMALSPVIARVIFGCSMEPKGPYAVPEIAHDGVLGLKPSNISFLGQLVSAKLAANKFSFCLDPMLGGVFVIGHVVEPKVTKTTPLLNSTSSIAGFAVNLTGMDVGGKALEIPSEVFEVSDTKGGRILNTQLVNYLPEPALTALVEKIESILKTDSYKYQYITCINYTDNNKNIDDVFPNITFHFDGSLDLILRPSEYITSVPGNGHCLSFVSSASLFDFLHGYFILGEMSMGNKLMVFDLDNNAVGWVPHNCSMGVKVQDDTTGGVYYLKPEVSGHVGLEMGTVMLMVVVVSTMLHFFIL